MASKFGPDIDTDQGMFIAPGKAGDEGISAYEQAVEGDVNADRKPPPNIKPPMSIRPVAATRNMKLKSFRHLVEGKL
jgi:hypothetical protein